MSVLILVAVVAAVISMLVSHVLTSRRLVVIHDLVNSNLTRVQADLQMAQKRIEVLEQHLVDTGRVSPRPGT